MTTRAALYMRISDDQDGEQQATMRQRADCLAFAERKGWEVVEAYEDVDISAFRNVRRPAFEAMLSAVAEGRIDVVVSWKMDRLSRRLKDLVRLDEVCEAASATVATVVDGVDTSTASGKFVSELLVAQAKMESGNTSTRVKRALAQQAADGKPKISRFRAFGYDRRLEHIIPAEAAVIRESVRRVLDGESMHSICVDLNRRGIRTTEGCDWRIRNLTRTITSAYVSGQREYGGHLTPGRWEPIIAPAEMRRVRAITAARTWKGRPAVSPLAGLIKCGICGCSLSHWGRVGQPRRYRCAAAPGMQNCGHITVAAEPVEDAVGEAVLIALEGAELPAVSTRNTASDAVVAAEADMAELAGDYYARKLIGKAEFMSARGELQTALDKARAALARGPANHRPVKRVGREEWAAMDVDTRRSVAAMLLERVEVHAAPKRGRVPFDPSRLRFVWLQ